MFGLKCADASGEGAGLLLLVKHQRGADVGHVFIDECGDNQGVDFIERQFGERAQFGACIVDDAGHTRLLILLMALRPQVHARLRFACCRVPSIVGIVWLPMVQSADGALMVNNSTWVSRHDSGNCWVVGAESCAEC